MEQFENISGPDKNLLTTKIMQLELAELHSESIETFIEKHAKDFRKIITEHPELLEKFEQNHDGALDELGKYLYH